jgi:hypothetical protein
VARLAAWLVLLLAFGVFAFSGAGLLAESSWADEPPAAPYKVPEAVYTEPVVDPEPADCPEAPGVLEDGESVEEQYSVEAHELRFQRIATARMCEALADRSDVVSERLWWAVVELAEGRGQRAITNAKLTELLGEGCADPCPVTFVSDDGQTAELAAAIDASGEGNMTALYLIAGLVVALFVGNALMRTVDRGT